jgi:pimeloyl-ACP methyl ester carboxylesterase
VSSAVRADPVETRSAAGLNVAEWPGDGPPILALHGLTWTHHTWGKLASDFPSRRVIAPDLRGRGGSEHVGGPYGVPAHARDAARLMEELDLQDVVLVGHSMGAFAAPLAARLSGGRVARMVLLDGGPPVPLPFLFIRPVVRKVFERQAFEVSMPFDSVEELMKGKFGTPVKDHPDAKAAVTIWLEASAVGDEDTKFAPIDPEAVPVDGVSTFFDPELKEAARNLACPAHLLYATWGAKDGARPFYTPKVADRLERSIPNLKCTRVERVNHLTLLFAPEVTRAIGS